MRLSSSTTEFAAKSGGSSIVLLVDLAARTNEFAAKSEVASIAFRVVLAAPPENLQLNQKAQELHFELH
jgi:hypothetical protein